MTAFGDAPALGWPGSAGLAASPVGLASAGAGYWVTASDGGAFSDGATFHGSTGAVRLASPVVGMAAPGDGAGYWLVAAGGGVFAFGAARFSGSASGLDLAAAVVGMAALPDGSGYWLVAAGGGVFAFGAAPFIGSGAPG